LASILDKSRATVMIVGGETTFEGYSLFIVAATILFSLMFF